MFQFISSSTRNAFSPGLFEYALREGIPDESCQAYEAVDNECSPFRQCMSCDSTPSGRLGLETKDGCYAVENYGRYFVKEYGTVSIFAIEKELAEANVVGGRHGFVRREYGIHHFCDRERARSSFASQIWTAPPLYSSHAHDAFIHRLKSEIFVRGPVSCTVDAALLASAYIPGEILNYTKPLWPQKEWAFDHIVGVAGWHGATSTRWTGGGPQPSWLVRNSWGTSWGEKGFARVALGLNSTGIESICAWAVPDPTPKVKNWGPADEDGHIFTSTDYVRHAMETVSAAAEGKLKWEQELAGAGIVRPEDAEADALSAGGPYTEFYN